MSDETENLSARMLAMWRLQLAMAHTLKKHEPELFNQVMTYMELYRKEAQQSNKHLILKEIEMIIRGLELQFEAPAGTRRPSLSIVPNPSDEDKTENPD